MLTSLILASKDQGVVLIFMTIRGADMFFLPRLILLPPVPATLVPVLFFLTIPRAKLPFGAAQYPGGGVIRREDKVFKFFSCQN